MLFLSVIGYNDALYLEKHKKLLAKTPFHLILTIDNVKKKKKNSILTVRNQPTKNQEKTYYNKLALIISWSKIISSPYITIFTQQSLINIYD